MQVYNDREVEEHIECLKELIASGESVAENQALLDQLLELQANAQEVIVPPVKINFKSKKKQKPRKHLTLVSPLDLGDRLAQEPLMPELETTVEVEDHEYEDEFHDEFLEEGEEDDTKTSLLLSLSSSSSFPFCLSSKNFLFFSSLDFSSLLLSIICFLLFATFFSISSSFNFPSSSNMI